MPTSEEYTAQLEAAKAAILEKSGQLGGPGYISDGAAFILAQAAVDAAALIPIAP